MSKVSLDVLFNKHHHHHINQPNRITSKQQKRQKRQNDRPGCHPNLSITMDFKKRKTHEIYRYFILS